MKKLIFTLFCIAILFSVLSCRDFDEEDGDGDLPPQIIEDTTTNKDPEETAPSETESAMTGSITVSVVKAASAARTIAPASVSLSELTYTLTGVWYENGVPKSTSTLLEDRSYDEMCNGTEIVVSIGKWIFLLTASKNGTPFYQSQISAVIDIGANLPVSFVLKEVRGEGSIAVSLSFPNNSEIVKIDAGLLSLSLAEVQGFPLADITYTKKDSSDGKKGTVTYEASGVPSGNYILQFKFYRAASSVTFPEEIVRPEEILPGYMEIVQIRNGRESSESREIEELEKYHKITYEWNAGEEEIDFSEDYDCPMFFNEQKEITLPTADDISREGYNFLGWCEDEKLTSTKKTLGWSAEQSDVTLYAKWQRNVNELGEYKELGSGDADGTESVAGGKYVTFGVFPKTLKESVVKILYKEGDAADENKMTQGDQTWYLGSDGEWYAPRSAKPYGASRKFSDGSAIVNGTTYYFKVCPVKWRVLASGKLLSESIVETMPYKSTYPTSTPYANNYEKSAVRTYLNDSFLKAAFIDAWQLKIKATAVSNDASHSSDSSGAITKADGTALSTANYICANTSDKIFLLSEKEVTVTSDSFGAYTAQDKARVKLPTDWARANGAYYDSATGAGYWWLRSPYYYADFYVQGISPKGDANGAEAAMLDDTGVVPALCVN